MGDVGDYWNEARAERKELRDRLGVECPRCKERRPKASASILLPQQRCRVDGYRDPRRRKARRIVYRPGAATDEDLNPANHEGMK